MPFWQLYYHIVWATKNREPILTLEVEPIVHDLLRAKAIGLEAVVFALNGTEDHIHMIAAIPPKLAVAKFIGQVKAVAATRFNKSGAPGGPLFWQEEYGVFSFDGKRLANHISYVERQKEHHATNTEIPILERISGEGVRMVRDSTPEYHLDELSI